MGSTAIIYWSGTGNTEAMANGIAKGLTAKGAEVASFEAAGAPTDLSAYEKVVFGCPSMGSEELEESVFEPYFSSVEASLAGKKVALFGSYGWGDGEWMRTWAERVKDGKANLFDDGLIQNEAPDEAACVEYGERLAAF